MEVHETKMYEIVVMIFWSIVGNAIFFGLIYVFHLNYSIWQLLVAFIWVVFCIFNTIRIKRNEENNYTRLVKPLNHAD
ncbi:hypothetical protein [Lederbergia lenta]|uniref:hypothetical protein n=1 Tax=Lederbergia lenta TaxID=1467 RepID=UPI002041AC8E|nr:hypothetical protein [Lederbergia lenta]MCM3113615.1 hypothetical protein [Lederbergia lenta]